MGCDVSWRDKVLTRCSGNKHPSSLPVEGAGRARVLAPPALWCHALVATGVVRHQPIYRLQWSITLVTFKGYKKSSITIKLNSHILAQKLDARP